MDASHDMRVCNSHRLDKCLELQYKAADLLSGNSATRQMCVSCALRAAPAGGDSADQP